MNSVQITSKKMQFRAGRGLLLVLFLFPLVVHAWLFRDDPDRVVLHHAIMSGDVTLKARGDGKVNGPAVKGWLVNNTMEAKAVSVILVKPLYLRNSDRSAQNMIATRVYRLGATGRLPPKEDDDWKYILLGEREHVPIEFIAYCADQGKSTPDASDSFRAGLYLPYKFERIVRKINRYRAENEDVDVFDGAQIAIWHDQDVPVRAMRRLEIDDSDIQIANEVLRTE